MIGEKLRKWDQSGSLYYTSVSKRKKLDKQIGELDAELNLVAHLISRHASDLGFHFQDKHGNTLLHLAHYPGVVRWLIAVGLNANAKNDFGQTPLHICKKADCAKMLLQAGADVRSEDYVGKTPLHYAMEADLEKIAVLLLEHKANPQAKDHEGKIPCLPKKMEAGVFSNGL